MDAVIPREPISRLLAALTKLADAKGGDGTSRTRGGSRLGVRSSAASVHAGRDRGDAEHAGDRDAESPHRSVAENGLPPCFQYSVLPTSTSECEAMPGDAASR